MKPRIFHHSLPNVYLNVKRRRRKKHSLSFISTFFYDLGFFLRSPFVHPTPSLPAEKLPEGLQHNRHQNSLPLPLLPLLSHTTQLTTFNMLSSTRLHKNPFINVRQDILWTYDRTGAGSIVQTPWNSSYGFHRYSLRMALSQMITSQKSETNIKRKCQIILFRQRNLPH